MNQYVRKLPQYQCHVCGGEINTWDFRLTGALNYDHATCEKCIAKEYGETVESLRATVEEFFGMKPCLGV